MVHSPPQIPHKSTSPSSLNLYSPQISKTSPPSRILLCFSTLLHLQFQCKLMNSSQTSFLFHMTSFPLINLPHQFPPSFSFKNIKKTSKSIIKCSFHNNKGFYHQPFSVLLPIIKKIKSLTSLKGSNSGSCVQSIGEGDILHKNGTFLAMAVSAKVKISPFVATLAANPTFVSGLFAWFIAQSMKVFLNFWLEKRWDFRVMCASGGMPSSHTALCTALTTSVAICHGVADSLFPVCLGFSLIVMYDAIGVRRHAGMQAEVLNMIIADLFQGHPISQRKLKELLGHTPSQVLAGALLGIVVAWFCCQGYLITPRV